MDQRGTTVAGPTPPRFLMWAVYNDCNFTCQYCPIPEELLRPKSMAFKRFQDLGYHERILGFFQKLHDYSGAWVVCLTGGEPLLMPNLEYLTSGLIRIGHQIRYNTNLSIALERRPEWFAANPPTGVDLLMVSIHKQTDIDAVFARVSKLKSLGYRVIVRVVCTPEMMDLLDELEQRFRTCDVSLTPLPEFEFRAADATLGAMPRAYSFAQKRYLEERIKGFGELAMLYGGIDVSDRRCFAGSRMLFMHSHSVKYLAQISRCNLTSEYVMADVAEFIGPNARGIESLLLPGPLACLRQNKRCDCPGLVENDTIEGVPARFRYEQMSEGYVPALGASSAEWIREFDIRFGENRTDPGEPVTQISLVAPPHLVETVGAFNIVTFKGSYLGVPHSLGPMDLAQQDLSALPGLIVADSLQDARRMIRTVE
jgi:organic radical activating enzyme